MHLTICKFICTRNRATFLVHLFFYKRTDMIHTIFDYMSIQVARKQEADRDSTAELYRAVYNRLRHAFRRPGVPDEKEHRRKRDCLPPP